MKPVRIYIVLDREFEKNISGESRLADYLPDFEFIEYRDGAFFSITGPVDGMSSPIELSSLAKGYIYWPRDQSGWLTANHLRNVALALATNSVDFALVSSGLTELPDVAVGCLKNSIVIGGHVGIEACRSPGGMVSGLGKMVRLLPYHGDENTQTVVNVATLFPDSKISIDADCHRFSLSTRSYTEPPRNDSGEGDWHFTKHKPVVFTFPIFLAVGGVERNTIEVMARLNGDYEFIVITMERLQAQQGSLHHQAEKVCRAVYDLAEIAPHQGYLAVLAYLKELYKPDIVWVCNGSPWFCDNAGKIRDLFYDSAIIDQEVYDVREGWINRYHEAGIQSFDRFIAVTEKIRHVFLEKLQMPEARVDLIYSVVNSEKFLAFEASRPNRDALLRHFGLPDKKYLYVFMGRLSAQKRPGLFLQIAAQRRARTDELFILIGDGDLADEMQSSIERGALSNVIRIRYIENTPAIFSLANAMIITSAYEALPIAMLEALCMGVPVLAADVGDIRAVLEKFGGGKIVPPDYSADQWASELQIFRDELPQYQDRLKRERGRVREQFSSETIAEQYKVSWARARLQRSGAHR